MFVPGNLVRPRSASSSTATTKESSDEDKSRSRIDTVSTTPPSGSDKEVSREKKRKAEEAGREAQKRRKVTGAAGKQESKVTDRVTDPEASKTGESKADGPELPGSSTAITTTTAGPKDGHVTDQKSGKSSKSTASAGELSGTPTIGSTKDHVTDPATKKPSTSKAAGPELTGTTKDDCTDTGKSTAAGPELSGPSKKRSATDAGLEEKSQAKKIRRPPVGLYNFHRACFANSITRCLHGTGPFNKYYRAQASGVLRSVASCGATERDFRAMRGKTTRANKAKRDLVRNAFQKSVDQVSLSAYFGDLCERLTTSTEPSISPFVFQQAFGTLMKDDEGESMDGEKSEDSHQFLAQLLGRLRQEELMSRETGPEAPTVVEKVFGVRTAAKVTCKDCQHEHTTTSNALWLDADIPRQKKPLTLEECFSVFQDNTQPSDYRCESCGKAGSSEKLTSISEFPRYLIFNLNRVDANGKNNTKVRIPGGVIDLSVWSTASASQGSNFEVYGVVQHRGASFTDGHYDTLCKTKGEWWHLDDHKVSRLADADLNNLQPQTGCQIFLRKVSS